MKVRQPWATALVSGQKDVENRTWRLKSTSPWVLIAASKPPPTRAMLDEYRDRLRRHYGVPAQEPDEYVVSHILGLVKIAVYSPEELPWPSVWHNPPDLAWVVEDAWEFETPVPLHADDSFQIQVKLEHRAQYRAAVAAEIRKLRAAPR